MLDQAGLESIHLHCSHHRAKVLASAGCGCFYCLTLFSPTEIREWIPARGGRRGESTAVCPHCGIDAVLPDTIPGVDFGEPLLREMNEYWFADKT